MADAVALLRGMNVGGHRITNGELVAIFADLGIPGAVAYQASGNVLFDLRGEPVDCERVLEEGFAHALGYGVPTMVRTASQIQDVLALDPHSADGDRRPAGKQQIVFLKAAPSTARAAEIEALAPDGDRLTVLGREMHWWPDGGVAESEIDWAAVDRTFGPLTMRTRGTVDRIAGKLSGRVSVELSG